MPSIVCALAVPGHYRLLFGDQNTYPVARLGKLLLSFNLAIKINTH